MKTILLSVLFSSAVAHAAVSLMPMPRRLAEKSGFYVSSNGFDKVAIEEMHDASVRKEGYRLEVTGERIRTWASSPAGFFYARQTLRQVAQADGKQWRYPCVEIEDWPEYGWRGVMLDEGRHFFGKETVRKIMDLMAMYKLNVFHWHLTEDQGWRLDIPAYPKLAECGSMRRASAKHGATLKKIAPFVYRCTEVNTQKYGPFFYTAEDVKEILAYAKERHIEVIPEIDLPGHAKAALGAYPEMACFPERIDAGAAEIHWGIHRDVFCMGNDKTIRFLEDVIDYVCELFPSKIVHIGGDECPRLNWEECPKCQARMKKEGMKHEKELQAWITRRIAERLEKKGRRLMGWDEILEGDVPKSAIGMIWRTVQKDGEAKLSTPLECAMKGHDLVMTPSPFCYFSARQGLKHEPYEREGRIITLEKSYSFDPVADIPEGLRNRIIGGQCCMWSEYLWNEYDLAWRMWPRTFATAEILWSAPKERDFAEFSKRAETELRRLHSIGVQGATLE